MCLCCQILKLSHQLNLSEKVCVELLVQAGLETVSGRLCGEKLQVPTLWHGQHAEHAEPQHSITPKSCCFHGSCQPLQSLGLLSHEA